MVGGMVSNNSSGMCCGVSQNTYHTLKDMRVVFLDGTVLDTKDPKSREAFLEVRWLFADARLSLAWLWTSCSSVCTWLSHDFLAWPVSPVFCRPLLVYESVKHMLCGSTIAHSKPTNVDREARSIQACSNIIVRPCAHTQLTYVLSDMLQTHKELVAGVLDLAGRVQADKQLTALIRRKFAIKCTTGYSLNALVDFSLDDPIEIIKRLMIGSEGTFGFVSEATYNCVPEWPHKVSPLPLVLVVNVLCICIIA